MVGRPGHRDWIVDPLDEIGAEAKILPERQARDSAPAMAVAALWIPSPLAGPQTPRLRGLMSLGVSSLGPRAYCKALWKTRQVRRTTSR